MKYLTTALLSAIHIFGVAQDDKLVTCSAHKSLNSKSAKSNNLNAADLIFVENYDVKYVKLDIEMSNLNKSISGWAETQATARLNLDSIIYELHSNFTITQLLVDNVSTPYVRSGTTVRVPVSKLAGQNFSVKTYYNGVAPDAGGSALGSAAITNSSSPTWGNQVTWSLSESFGSYQWWPSKMSLRDKIDSCAVSITVPDVCKAGSNGLLTSIDPIAGNKLKFNWKHNHVIDYYLISVAIAEYVEYTIYANPVGAIAPIMIQNYVYNNPGTLPYFQTNIDETVDFLELYSNIFGMYPFADEKYGHCQAPLGGGMEHQTMTTQSTFNKDLTSHELAHQWWGDNVTCSSWADIWVNEGFASYSELIMYENMYPTQFDVNLNERHDAIMAQPGGSTWVLDSLNESRIFSSRLTYDKGAAIVHTMRGAINNDIEFFNGLKQIQIDFKDSTLSGIEVKNSLEAASGENLTDVFNQWYFGEGFPTYNVTWNQIGSVLVVKIDHSTSMPTVTPTFTTPLELKITRVGSTDTLIRFAIPSNSITYSVDLNGTANTFTVDPKNWIINAAGTIVNDVNLLNMNEYDEISQPLTISPNPTADNILVSYSNGSGSFTIVNTAGKIVTSGEINQIKQNIDLSMLANGTYVFNFTSINGITINKLLVKK